MSHGVLQTEEENIQLLISVDNLISKEVKRRDGQLSRGASSNHRESLAEVLLSPLKFRC